MASPNSKSKREMSTASFSQYATKRNITKMIESKTGATQQKELCQTTPVNGIQTENSPEGNIKTMMNYCQWCNVLTSPKKRYRCPAGHTFCAFCGEERIVTHGAKCMIEIIDGQMDFGSSNNAASLIPRITTPYHRMNGYQTHFPVCQQQITFQPPDPIYTAMWNRTEWVCPGGCNQVFKGRNLAKHLLYCEKRKKTSRLGKTPEHKLEELSVAPASSKGELAGNHKLVMPNPLIGCNTNGCSMQMRVKDLGRHIVLDHQAYTIDVGDDERFGNIFGLLYIPQTEIEAKRPFYTLVRRCRRSFLFCMEPATDTSDGVGFWIRRISKMENKEEDNGPYFKYNLRMRNGNMQVIHKNGCIPWDKPTNEIFNDKKCLKLPISLILDELVIACADKKCRNEKNEMGYLLVNFEIMIVNAVGEFYWNDAADVVTSSMESLTISTPVDCTDQRQSDKIEVVQESENDNDDVDGDVEKEVEEEAFNDDDDDGIVGDDEKGDEKKAANVDDAVENVDKEKDEEGKPQPLVINAVEEKVNKMKEFTPKGKKFVPNIPHKLFH